MARRSNGSQVDAEQQEIERQQIINSQLATAEDMAGAAEEAMEAMSMEAMDLDTFNQPGFQRPSVLVLSTFSFENGTQSESIADINDFHQSSKMWQGIRKNLRGAVNNGPGATVVLRLATKEDVRRVMQAQVSKRFKRFSADRRFQQR